MKDAQAAKNGPVLVAGAAFRGVFSIGKLMGGPEP